MIEIPSENYEEFGDIHKTLQHILDTIVASYTSAGIDIPERQFTAVGDVASSIANDCEQVTVNFIQAYVGLPGQPDVVPRGCPLPMSADFVAQVTRCVPGGVVSRTGSRAPAVAAIEASTLIQAVDAQILLQSVDAMSSIQGKSATVAPSGVDGKYQSMMLNLSISLFRE